MFTRIAHPNQVQATLCIPDTNVTRACCSPTTSPQFATTRLASDTSATSRAATTAANAATSSATSTAPSRFPLTRTPTSTRAACPAAHATTATHSSSNGVAWRWASRPTTTPTARATTPSIPRAHLSRPHPPSPARADYRWPGPTRRTACRGTGTGVPFKRIGPSLIHGWPQHLTPIQPSGYHPAASTSGALVFP